MSIATDETVRQLLKRVLLLEEKVKQLEAARDALIPVKGRAKSLIDRARAAISPEEQI